MQFTWKRATVLAVVLFVILVVIRFLAGSGGSHFETFSDAVQNQANDLFDIGRKNYASTKQQASAGAPAIGDSQKYEKVGSLTQLTHEYEADRKRVDELISGNGGIVQLERATGLDGGRNLHLGIGVPPEKFDQFISAARTIGKGVSIEIVKNDKTNEYLQLKARRATLEKARSALEELKSGGGSTSERVSVQNRLTEIEQQIQDLGVSLGEFDSQNELCTVKLTLREARKARPISLTRRAMRAFEAALADYMMLGIGFFGVMAAAWIATRVAAEARRMMANPPSA